MASKERMELDDQERMAKFLEKQIERAKDTEGVKQEVVHTELQRDNEEEKVQFDFSKPSTSKPEQSQRSSTSSNPLSRNSLKQDAVKKNSASSSSSSKHSAKRKSALEEIIEEEKSKKKKPERQENWITEGIVVKIITKKLGEKYYKKKGVVKEVKNLFVAIVEILESGDVLKLDQAHLETVIPQPGRLVKIVNGTYRGLTATMVDLDEKSFSVSVRLEEGSEKGKKISGIVYEAVCKLA